MKLPTWLNPWRELRQLEAECNALTAEKRNLNTIAVDRRYMIEALVSMLGPNGLKVWQHWQDSGVKRTHVSWEPDAWKLSGEERAENLFKFITYPGELVTEID